jgi:UDP-glucose 4-epimerase
MPERFRRALVTGGAGFIGGHLVRALLARGIGVTVLDDLSVGRRENVPDAAKLIVGDVIDPEATLGAVAGCDVVFHLAARVAIRSSFEFVVEDTKVNVAGTASVLRAAAKAGGVHRFVTTSSMAVYADAPSPAPIDERHPTVPVSPYGISKLASEALVHLMCAERGIGSACVRLFNTFGPGQALSPYVGVVTIFVNRLRAGERATIYGDGEQCRDFVHVDDVVRGFLCAMDGSTTGETYNIGSGVATSVNQVLARVSKELGRPFDPAYADAVPGELRFSVADTTKAREQLGYVPSRSFDEAIGEVVTAIARSA